MKDKSTIGRVILASLVIILWLGTVFCYSAEIERGNIIRIVSVDVDPQNEAEFNRWYNEEHEPLLQKVPGVIATFKGKNLGEKGQKYFFLYVHKNIEVQKSEVYREASTTKWAKEVRPFLKNFEGRNYEVILPGRLPGSVDKGNIIRTVEVSVALEQEQDFNDWYNKEHIPTLMKVPGVISVWRAINLGEKGPKYLTVYFQENMAVQERDDYKKASQTDWIKRLRPFLKGLTGANYEVIGQ
jgi:antibiotic biosynthesis monooxygenase (ABM) superfamily enzyme